MAGKSLDKIQKAQLARESQARRQLAEIIYEAGRKGISEEALYNQIYQRKIGRVGFRNDVDSVLESFAKYGMITVQNLAHQGKLPQWHYAWIGRDLKKYKKIF